jgi:hypothetical protein
MSILITGICIPKPQAQNDRTYGIEEKEESQENRMPRTMQRHAQ